MVIGAGIASAALVAVGWVVLWYMGARAADVVTAADVDRSALIARAAAVLPDAKALATLGARAAATRVILARHRAWGPFFRLLESRTLPDVAYVNVNADAAGMVTVSATAPSIRTAMEQVVAWRAAELVRAVDLASIASTVDDLGVTRGVRFDLKITLAPDAFAVSSPSTSPSPSG